MKRRFLIVILALVMLLAVFLFPVIPYSSSYYQVGGGTYDHWNAPVSASYLIFNCGIAFNLNLTTLVVGNGSWVYSKNIGSMLVCFSQPNQILGHPYSVVSKSV